MWHIDTYICRSKFGNGYCQYEKNCMFSYRCTRIFLTDDCPAPLFQGRRQGYAPVWPGIPLDFGPNFFCIRRPKPWNRRPTHLARSPRCDAASSLVLDHARTPRRTDEVRNPRAGRPATASAAPPHRRTGDPDRLRLAGRRYGSSPLLPLLL